MTNDRAIYGWVVVSIYPGKIYSVAARFTFINIIVRLEIVNNKEVGCSEAPERACPRAVCACVICLINTPVVGSIPLKLSGFEAFGAKVSAAFKLQRSCIRAEIDFICIGKDSR